MNPVSERIGNPTATRTGQDLSAGDGAIVLPSRLQTPKLQLPDVPDPRPPTPNPQTQHSALSTQHSYEGPITPEALAARLGVDVASLVKLDSNENPYGAPPAALAALARVVVHRYPDAAGADLRRALGVYTGGDPARIVLGNGSDELIDLLCRRTLGPGDEVVVAPPTFSLYALAAQAAGATVREARRGADLTFDLAGVLAATNARTRLIFLCAPNNPTGDALPAAALHAILALGPLVVLDEAYAEFAGAGYIGLVNEAPNLVVLRTFSKAFGLAGLRLGYGVFPEIWASDLRAAKLPYNVSAAALAAGLGALADRDWVERHLALLRAARDRLAAALQAIPGLDPLPSAANFVLVRATDRPASAVHAALLERGVMVRHFSAPPLDAYLRITVGTPEQNDVLLEALQAILGEEAA